MMCAPINDVRKDRCYFYVVGPNLIFSGQALLQSKSQFYCDEHAYRFARPRTRLEAPLLGGFDRLVIKAVRPIERSHNINAANAAVGKHDTFQQYRALNL